MTSWYVSPSDYAKHGLAAWRSVASALLQRAGDRRVWCFEGALGSGKTTCIQALCAALGVQGVVQSPTFGLIHEYAYGVDQCVYHFDMYRLQRVEEAMAIGVEDYLDSGAYCFIEWPALLNDVLPARHVRLSFACGAEGGRRVEATMV